MTGRCKRRLFAVLATLLLLAVWYGITRSKSQVLQGQDHVVAFSADGRVLATIGQDGGGALWDPETGRLRNDLAGSVSGLSFPFSPDGRYFVRRSPSDKPPDTRVNGKVDREDFEKKWKDYLEKNARIRSLTAVAETKTQRNLVQFHCIADSFRTRCLGFSSDGQYFFAQRSQKDYPAFPDTSCVWSLSDARKVYEEQSYLQAISHDGKKLARAAHAMVEGKQIPCLDIIHVEDGETELTFAPLDLFSEGTTFSTDGSRVMQIDGSHRGAWGVAALYDLESGKQALLEGTPTPLGFGEPTVPQFIHGDQLVEVQRLTPRFQWVTVCTATTEDFRIVWDARSISINKQWCFREYYVEKKRTVLKVFEVSPDVATQETGLNPRITYEYTFDSLLYPRQAAISDDGRIVVMVMGQSDVMVVDMIDKSVLLERTFHPSWIHGIYLSPNGRHVAATVHASEGPEVHVIQVP